MRSASGKTVSQPEWESKEHERRRKRANQPEKERKKEKRETLPSLSSDQSSPTTFSTRKVRLCRLRRTCSLAGYWQRERECVWGGGRKSAHESSFVCLCDIRAARQQNDRETGAAASGMIFLEMLISWLFFFLILLECLLYVCELYRCWYDIKSYTLQYQCIRMLTKYTNGSYVSSIINDIFCH